MKKICFCCLAWWFFIFSGQAAVFDGSSGVQIIDPTGGLSWEETNNALSISCWFKISVPTGKSVAQNMTILADRTTGAKASSPYSYLIQYNVGTGDVEFSTRGTNTVDTVKLIERPYLDRWYHVAVVRSGSLLYPYIDGKDLPAMPVSAVAVENSDGVGIGSWGSTDYFLGEIQEVCIYQSSIAYMVEQLMFLDIDPSYHDALGLKGYYKLSKKADSGSPYINEAASAPADTSPGVKVGNGIITFFDGDTSTEQSLFDSKKDGGKDSIIPLSGAFF